MANNTGTTQSPATTQGHVTAYDPNVNYKDLMDQAYREGRYSDAAYYEQLRNQKIDDLNAAGGGTNQYGAEKSNNYSQYLGSGYTSLNASINGNSELHYDTVDQLKAYLQQNPSAAAQLSQEDLRNLAAQYGIDPALLGSFSHQGGYTQDRNTALAGGGTGQPVEGFYEDGTRYYYPGTDRTVKEGTSGADERFLSDGAYALVQALSAEWFRLDALATAAKNSGNTELYNQYIADRNQCNITANQIRNTAGYSGGTDGSMYIPNGQLGITDPFRGGNDHVSSRVPVSDPSSTLPSGGVTIPSGGSGGNNGGSSGTIQTQSNLKDLLDAWQQAAMSQSDGKVDYAVAKAVADLERALQDAQPQFKEQAESIDRNARQAMDNSALYAEMRGDKGGIGQEQYNSIQNTQAQNHLSVQQAQTKLATDTQRQIADLRAQGEFEKADAALEITQTYLAQLISLEQWAAQHNLSVDQFNAQLRQWELEYQLALKQFEVDKDLAYGQLTGTIPSTGQSTLANQQFQAGLQQWEQEFGFQQQQYQNALSQWEKEFAFQQQQYQNSLALNQQSQMADIAWALLQSGVELDAAQLQSLGISAEQATSLLLQAQMKENSKNTQNTTSTGKPTTKPASDQSVYEWLYSQNAKDYGTAYEALRNSGYNTTDANRYAKYYTETWLVESAPEQVTWGEGYNADRNVGGVKASEWEYVRNNVLQGLMRKDFAAVEEYLDMVAAGFSEAQWIEIQMLLDAYGFYSQQK